MELEWEHVAGPFSRLTEGPAWDGNKLLFTFIPGNQILAYDPETGDCTCTGKTPTTPTAWLLTWTAASTVAAPADVPSCALSPTAARLP